MSTSRVARLSLSRAHFPLRDRNWLIAGSVLSALLLAIGMIAVAGALMAGSSFGRVDTATTISVLIAESDFPAGDEAFRSQLAALSGVEQVEFADIEDALKDVPWDDDLPRLFAVTMTLAETADSQRLRAEIGAQFPGAIAGNTLVVESTGHERDGNVSFVSAALALLSAIGVMLVSARWHARQNAADLQLVSWLGADVGYIFKTMLIGLVGMLLTAFGLSLALAVIVLWLAYPIDGGGIFQLVSGSMLPFILLGFLICLTCAFLIAWLVARGLSGSRGVSTS